MSGQKPPGGSSGLPPPELGFIDWIKDATTTAKAKYKDALLISADAQKQTGGKRKEYDLLFSARFRVNENKEVTVKGDNKTISSPTNISLGLADVKNLTQVKVEPWGLTTPDYNIGNISLYERFVLFKYLNSSTFTPPMPDQPYYEFQDKDQNRLAIVGATDGKIYAP